MNSLITKLSDPRIVLLLTLLAMLALAMAAGAPEGGSCGCFAC